VQELEKSKPVILTGDLNCAHQEIDIFNPAVSHLNFMCLHQVFSIFSIRLGQQMYWIPNFRLSFKCMFIALNLQS
jgi:exonuclease III